MSTAQIKISDLIERLKGNRIKLPEMQRKYIWSSKQVQDLLDSIYRGYPSGAILLWEPPTENAPVPVESAIQQEASSHGYQLLLDGQQRLTSLLAAMKGEVVQKRGAATKIEIMFNMDHPDAVENEDDDEGDESSSAKESLENAIFAAKTKNLEGKPNWISVTEVFQSRWGTLAERVGNCPSKYMDRLEKLRDISEYKYDVTVIGPEVPYEEVAKIFVRVNSLGTKLRGSDLALAQITAMWPGTRSRAGALGTFEKYIDKCRKRNHDIAMGTVIRNLVVFASGQGKFHAIPTSSKLKENWEDSSKGMDAAIDFVTNDVGMESLELVSSPFCLIVVAMCSHLKGHKLSSADKKKLKFWVLMAILKGRYAHGSSGTYLTRDIQRAKDITTLIINLRVQAGRLEVEPDDLRELNSKSAFFKILYVLLKQEGAKDWLNGSPIAWSNISRHNKLEFHHIFPKSQFKGSNINSRDINNIANLACLTRLTNEGLNNKLPEKYLPSIDSKLLEQHLIPQDPNLWKMENYLDFLKERQKMLAAWVNRCLKIKEMEASLKE